MKARNDQAAPEYTDDILELYRTGAKVIQTITGLTCL